MALDPNGPAPYAPFAPILLVIDRFRERGLQTPFTGEVLIKAGVSDSLAPRVLQSLKLLELIDDDGEPGSVLKDYARLPGGEARDALRAQVKDLYAPVFAFADPATDSPDRIRDAFRGFVPRGQQERMVSLFLAMCAHLELAPETVRRPHGPRPARTISHRKLSGRGPNGRAGRVELMPISQITATSLAAELPEAVQGLLRELAVIGPAWTAERRDQFMAAFSAVISFSYPVRVPATEIDP